MPFPLLIPSMNSRQQIIKFPLIIPLEWKILSKKNYKKIVLFATKKRAISLLLAVADIRYLSAVLILF